MRNIDDDRVPFRRPPVKKYCETFFFPCVNNTLLLLCMHANPC